MSGSDSIRVILKGVDNWDEWIEVTKSVAIKGKIWDLVNPSSTQGEVEARTKAVAEHVEPKRPRASTVGGSGATIESLSKDQVEVFKLLLSEYAYDIRIYESKENALNDLRIRIQETIHHELIPYTYQSTSAYDMLTTLKAHCAPTDEARRRELILKWKSLQQIRSGTDISVWMRSWELTYDKCERMKLPDVDGDRASYDFITAIQGTYPEYAAIWEEKLNAGEKVETKRLLESFRQHRRRQLAIGGTRAKRAAFAVEDISYDTSSSQTSTPSLQGRKPGLIDNRMNKSQDFPPCFCKGQTDKDACPYFNPNFRQKDWKPDPKIQKKTDDFLNRYPKLRTELSKRLPKKKEEKTTKKSSKPQSRAEESTSEDEAIAPPASYSVYSPASFTTWFGSSYDIQGQYLQNGVFSQATYDLHDSVILDSGSNIHVSNSRARMEDLRPSQSHDKVFSGGSLLQVEAWGTMIVNVTSYEGKVPVRTTIRLLNTALIPSFHTSVASFQRLYAKGVHWKTRTLRLVCDGKVVCETPMHFGQWCLEYNVVRQGAFPISSTDDLTRSGTIQQWHERLGHLNFEAIKHLPEQLQGVKVTTKSYDNSCEVCRLSNAKKIISRRTRARSEIPFERVHYDLIQVEPRLNDISWVLYF